MEDAAVMQSVLVAIVPPNCEGLPAYQRNINPDILRRRMAQCATINLVD